jgi:hypothetical protein
MTTQATTRHAKTPLPKGWTASAEHTDGIVVNPHPLEGGIVDQNIVNGQWFVIFNHEDLAALDGFATRDEALDACQAKLHKHGLITA